MLNKDKLTALIHGFSLRDLNMLDVLLTACISSGLSLPEIHTEIKKTINSIAAKRILSFQKRKIKRREKKHSQKIQYEPCPMCGSNLEYVPVNEDTVLACKHCRWSKIATGEK